MRLFGHFFEHAQAIGIGKRLALTPICFEHPLEARRQSWLLLYWLLCGQIKYLATFVTLMFLLCGSKRRISVLLIPRTSLSLDR